MFRIGLSRWISKIRFERVELDESGEHQGSTEGSGS